MAPAGGPAPARIDVARPRRGCTRPQTSPQLPRKELRATRVVGSKGPQPRFALQRMLHVTLCNITFVMGSRGQSVPSLPLRLPFHCRSSPGSARWSTASQRTTLLPPAPCAASRSRCEVRISTAGARPAADSIAQSFVRTVKRRGNVPTDVEISGAALLALSR
jgi:hypothetical protein